MVGDSMKGRSIIFIVWVLVCFFMGVLFMCKGERRLAHVKGISDIIDLFPTKIEEVNERVSQYLSEARKSIEFMRKVDNDQRTFENTARVIDHITSYSNLSIFCNILLIVEMVNSDSNLRQAAHDAVLTIKKFFVDEVINNIEVYSAFKAYVEGNAKKEKLNPEEQYFLKQMMDDFKRHGLDLEGQQLEKIKKLNKELAKITLEFDANIAKDKSSIAVSRSDLEGLDEDFIATLPKNESGQYILGVDYPTYFNVMDHCAVEDTRMRLYHVFVNRAYPKNEALLDTMITKRSDLAHILGFSSFASLDLDDNMVKTPERVQNFLHDLYEKTRAKEQEEFTLLTANLPGSVVLTEDGKLKPWDISYVKACYKRKCFNLDERLIAEYFPTEKTIAGLLDIYQQFLDLEFEHIHISGMWDEDVQLIAVYTKGEKQIIGYLLLDLYPRPDKFSHACQSTIVPAVKGTHGELSPAVVIVIANFPKSTQKKPSLLRRSDVSTFFHEFGHALHALLGCTEMAYFSGTNVKIDFVEMPSQMFEEWLWDKAILKKISSHYQTGKHMPDSLIDNIIAVKNLFSGFFITMQCLYSFLSLDCFNKGMHVNVYDLWENLYRRLNLHLYYDPDNHTYVSFGHLSDYGAQYYCYLWSRVYALDLFYEIKKHGLLDSHIGCRYKREVLNVGGSIAPDMILKNFLGREPNQEAFLKDLGLVK